MRIPMEIRELAVQATSNHNDGWAKKAAKQQLKDIRDYINGVLSDLPQPAKRIVK